MPGNDIVLSIDLQLQQYAEQTLQQGLREARTRCPFDSFTQSCGGPAFAAPAGSMVVEDPRNGQILAMATYPTFDNRWFVEGITNKKIQELYPDADKQAPFVNRAVSSPFQMGSTFKLVTTVAGLQSGIITPGLALQRPGHATRSRTATSPSSSASSRTPAWPVARGRSRWPRR